MTIRQRLRALPTIFIAGIYRAPLNKSTKPLPDGLQVRLADYTDLAPYIDCQAWPLKDGFVRDAFARGDACVIGLLGDQLATFGWVTYTIAPHAGDVWVRVGSGHRYNYKAFTAPQFRGRHLRGSYGVLDQRDVSEQVTHSLSYIKFDNRASIKSELRNGGQRVGIAGYIQIGRWFWSWSSPGASRFGFAFVRRKQ